MVEKKRFSKLLINWYNKHKRALPWREERNPYRIWLSEILLQQTRVAQGLPYYYRFLEAFPDIKALATASEKEVLRLWQGLGYYSRARNLHFTAKYVVASFNAQLPESYSELLKLKGIGNYTAAAIASFAYNEKVAVVDGNVYRVLSRVFGIKDDIASPSGQKKFQVLANELLPDADSSTYNQAIMEFGALQCLPQKPICDRCVLAFMCYAFLKKEQSKLPVKLKKSSKTNRYFHYLVIKSGNTYLMKERVEKDIWKGLYEFPLVEEKSLIEIGRLLQKEFGSISNKTIIKSESREYKHILSHQNLHVKFWLLESNQIAQKLIKIKGFKFFTVKSIQALPKPVLINKFLEEYVF
ncbi:MAG TPA: A/G-specific adenine glycosylase [Cytophagaceae bacterium]|jgi:A/G-specific adenine glycosylase|nr:A/G-specific adenine glycosylase [Cytophagaceae bacterium]